MKMLQLFLQFRVKNKSISYIYKRCFIEYTACRTSERDILAVANVLWHYQRLIYSTREGYV